MKNNFKDKKITMMGLGLLGRGVNVAKFLAKNGSILTITDLKTEKELTPSLKQLKSFQNIKYVLGKHDLADFSRADMVIKAAGVPLNSPYIDEARKNNIPVEMDASLFAKLSEAIIVGITGTRGKSTVTHLIYETLEKAGKKVFLGGNVKGLATLPLLEKVKKGDIVVMELDSWQLQGFGDVKISPHVSVFTNLMRDHMNYYKDDIKKYFEDKSNIFKYQTDKDFLIIGENFIDNTKKFGSFKNLQEFKELVKSKVITANQQDNWDTKLVGEHNARNITAAIIACQCLGIEDNLIKSSVENFEGVPGRLEFVEEINGVKYYNDTTATTPDGVIAGLEAFNSYKGKIILIGGGADKELVYDKYAEVAKNYVKNLILFKGSASDKIIQAIGKENLRIEVVDNMKDAVNLATKNSELGDIILLSPGAASFGIFKNEYDRGEQFCEIVKNL